MRTFLSGASFTTYGCRGLVLCLCLFAQRGKAETPLLPGEVVQVALQYSPLLKQYAEEISVARSRLDQAEGGGLPQVDARVQSLHFEGLKNEPVGGGEPLPVIENQSQASLGVTQLLYAGGRIAAQKRNATLLGQSVQTSRQAAVADIRLQTLVAYWTWSKALTLESSLTDAVNRVESYQLDTRHFRQAGLVTDNEVLAADVLVAQTRLRMEEARRQVAIARIRLGRIMGQPVPEAVNPLLVTTEYQAQWGASVTAGQKTSTNRLEIEAARLELQAAQARVAVAQGDTRPQVSWVARLEEGRPNLRDFPPLDEWKDDAYIGIALQWAVWDGGVSRSRMAEARARVRQAEWRIQDIQDGIASQIDEARVSLHYAISSEKTAGEAEQCARLALDSVKASWKEGLARSSEVLDSQSKLTDAATQRILAQTDILLAETFYLHALGQLQEP